MDHCLLGEPPLPTLQLGDKYARAIKQAAAAQPVLFPLAQAAQIDTLLALVDGVMLTGSVSNVHPCHFAQSVADPALPLDGQRDALTLALVRACLAQGVPLLGICRGLQEINVALGGSLHQSVHDSAGLQDHRATHDAALEQLYGPSHRVNLVPGSVLAHWAKDDFAVVNSLHGQGIDRLGAGLRVLAHAPDGLVEAVEVTAAKAFACAVQWHPEWRFWENDFYQATFTAFGQACSAHQRERLRRIDNGLARTGGGKS